MRSLRGLASLGLVACLVACGGSSSSGSGSTGGGGSDAGGGSTDAGTDTGGGSTDAGTGSGGGGSTDAGSGSGGGSSDAGTGGGSDAGTGGTASDCGNLVPSSFGTMVSWTGHYDGIQGISGLPVGSGDGFVAPMLSNIMHPNWTLVSTVGTATGTYGAWEGTLFGQPAGFAAWTYVSGSLYAASHVDQTGHSTVGTEAQLYGSEMVTAEYPEGGFVVAGQLLGPGGEPNRRRIQIFDTNGMSRFLSPLASDSAIFGLGVDNRGNTLVIQAGPASCGGCVLGQWFGRPGTAPFVGPSFTLLSSFVPGASTWFETGELMNGGLAIRRRDYEAATAGATRVTSSQWLVTVDALSTTSVSAPSWMQPDTDLQIVRGFGGYALLPNGAHNGACQASVSFYSFDGNYCGQVSSQNFSPGTSNCGDTYDLRMGHDGTLMYRLPPSLETVSAAGRDVTYSLRYWPRSLR